MIRFFGNRLIQHDLDFNTAQNSNFTVALKSLNLIAKECGKTFFDTVTVQQMHTNQVVHANEFEFISNIADGIVTNNPHLLLCVRTADCAPVLLEDVENQVIGAAHAGWRGALSGVIDNTVAKMKEIGAKLENIRAYIGPMLSRDSFECQQDMKDQFIKTDKSYVKFFSNNDSTKTMHFNFPEFIISRLEICGIDPQKITARKDIIDTYTSNDYHSYRRTVHQKLEQVRLNCSVISL